MGLVAAVGSVPPVSERLSILTVHAHPDDESSKGAGTIARYAAEGIQTTLVCCTGGEAGDILNPAMDREEIKADLEEVRRAELKSAADIIGYGEVIWLGYRDSGMPDTEENAHPEAFANADHDEALGKLVEIIRRVKPQVLISYPEDQKRYPHPDHLQVTNLCLPAWDAAGDASMYPGAGDPWTPQKMYCSMWSRARMVATHDEFLARGLESPFGEGWLDRPGSDHKITATVEVDNRIRREALLAHATQVDPKSPFWFGLPVEVQDNIHPFDDYMLMKSRIDVKPNEEDLFAGLRD